MKKENPSTSMPRMIMSVVLIVCVGALLGVAVYLAMNKTAKKEIIKTSFNSISKELTVESLKNAEYTFGLDNEKYKFTNGSYFKAYPDSPSGMGEYIGIFEDKIIFDDLNNDSKKEAVVILDRYGGGTGHFYEIAVVVNKNGEPRQIASEFLGDRPIINSLEIKDGKIIIDMVVQRPDDGACCPTLRKIFEYKLQNDKLVKTKEYDYNEVTSVDISNWKIYESSKMDFSIKIPTDFESFLDINPLDSPSYDELVSNFFVKNTDGNITREAILVTVESWTGYINSTGKEEPPSLEWIDSDIISRSRNDLNFKKEEFAYNANLVRLALAY